MPICPTIETFTNGQTLTHTSLNTLVSSLRDTVNTYGVLTDVSRTISAVQTFSAAPVFSAGFSVTGTLTMATGASKIVPGATSFSIRNNADGADNLLLTDAGAATFRSTVGGITTLSCTTVTATNLGGTVTTAAQPNITSFGALTSLSIGGNLTFTGTSRKIIGGSTSTLLRNTGDTATWLSFTESTGAVQVGGVSMAPVLGTATAPAGAGYPVFPVITGTPTSTPAEGAVVYDNSASAYKHWAYLAGAWRSTAMA